MEEKDRINIFKMKHFSESEFECNGEPCFDKMDKDFLKKLDEARGYSNSPFILNSTWRSKEHNKRVGGKPDSAHTRGCAADIATKTSRDRYNIIHALIMAGIDRIGIAKTFIHFDTDGTKPKEVVWLY